LQTEQSRHLIWEAIYSAVLSWKFTRQDEGPKVHLIDQSINIRFPEPNTYTPIHHDGLGDKTPIDFDFSRAATTGSGIEVETAAKLEPIVKANIPRSACSPDVSVQEPRDPSRSIVPPVVEEHPTVSKRSAAVDEVNLKSQQPMMGALVHGETSTVPLNCPNNRQHMSEGELLMLHLHPELDPEVFCVLPLASREPNITAASRTHNF